MKKIKKVQTKFQRKKESYIIERIGVRKERLNY